MNILVTVARTPFVPSAAGGRAAMLVDRLNAADGIRAELMTLPSLAADGGERQIDEAALCGLLRTANADRTIALNFPAYAMPFASHVVWIATIEDLPAAARAAASEGRAAEVARILARADADAFARSERLFCGSEPLRDAIAGWCGCEAEVLAVPAAADAAGWADAIARLAA